MDTARSFAAAQTTAVPGDVEANLEQHLQLARLAASAGERIVVFPELSLTGYELELAAELAFARDDLRLAPLAELSKGAGITLVVGAPLRLGSRLHIASMVLAPDGPPQLYTKRHLGAFPGSANPDGRVPPPEASCFEPGELDPLLAIGPDRIALAICADTARPAHARAAAERGATCYLASVFTIPSEHARESANLRDHAARHSLFVLMANYAAPTGGLAAAGRSAIWSPRGELLVELAPHGAGVAVAAKGEHGWHADALALDDG